MKASLILSGKYMDSTLLMKVSRQIQELDFVKQAVAVMGTEMNKTVIDEFGGMNSEVEAAGPNDLIISVDIPGESHIEDIRQHVYKLLENKPTVHEDGYAKSYPTIDLACQNIEDAGLALISLPGEFAAQEALKALDKNMHVFMFSDNVPLEDELEMKRIGREKGLLVMGPGAGTAVLDNVSIGLMSKVRPGNVGIVAASGSGLQEVAVLVHAYGLGISQAIGTGGRDLSKEVGGSTMLQGMTLLEDDPGTDVLVLVSKPPHPDTAQKIYARVKEYKKPVVIFFLGGDRDEIEASGAYYAATLENAAHIAVTLANGKTPENHDCVSSSKAELEAKAQEQRGRLDSKQKYLRGLFCGGTHCEEAVMLLEDFVPYLHSNIRFGSTVCLEDRHVSVGNSLVDMGDEEFTRGRLHPVMDPTILCDRLVQEASDPETAVILFDVILGYGVHEDPIGAIAPALVGIRDLCNAEGRYISIVSSICGTDLDPQDVEYQRSRLEDLGVLIESSNSAAALLAGLIVS